MADTTENPLNAFNTYSYHHFLIVSSSTEAAARLNDPQKFFDIISSNGDDQSIVLINPLTSNHYVIQEAEWTTIVVPNINERMGTHGQTTGEYTIVEPLGVEFMSDLNDALNKLKSKVECAVFTIKTTFMGDTGVGIGNSKYAFINTVQPLQHLWVDLGISFDESGGTYKVRFVSLYDGGGVLKESRKVDMSVNLGGSDDATGVTVEDALKNVEAAFNDSNKKKHEAYLQAHSQGGSSAPKQGMAQIVINVPESLKKPEYTVTSKTSKAAGAGNQSPILSMPSGTSISDYILEVLKLSEGLTKYCQEKNIQFRVRSSTNVQETGPEVKEIITFHIIEVNTDGGDREDPKLVYDYIYTGKNIDVLSFDMHIARGIAFFSHMMLSAGVNKDQPDEKQSGEYPASKSNTDVVGSTEDYTSVLPPTSPTPGTVSHSSDPSPRMSYDQLLRSYTMSSNMISEINIRGNPLILSNLAVTDSDMQAAADGSTDEQGEYMSGWLQHPRFCKINVKVPTRGDSSKLKQFWYDGPYRITHVINKFKSGEFLQTLRLLIEGERKYNTVPEDLKGGKSKNPTTPGGGNKPNKPSEPSKDLGIEAEVGTEQENVRAFLQLIRSAEGTAGEDGYNTLFGYEKFEGYDDHPRTLVVKSGYRSTAAGAYQIIEPTWNGLAKQYGFTDFSPETQDKAAIILIKQAGAYDMVKRGDIQGAISKTNKVWASLPGSPYGQPVITMDSALNRYNHYLDKERSGGSTLASTNESLFGN